MIKILISVFLMALVTYLPRVLPMVLFKKKIESKKFQAFLNYVPFAVLASMTIPDIFYSTSMLISGIVGTGVAVFLAYKEKGLVVVATGAIIAVYLTELIICYT